jgi:hypothetical protein
MSAINAVRYASKFRIAPIQLHRGVSFVDEEIDKGDKCLKLTQAYL